MKRALLIGINYEGTQHSLRGCINDIEMINNMLQSKFGYSDIRRLIEGEATTSNILRELERIVSDSIDGDEIYIHYSGHGSQIPDYNNESSYEEIDRLDEIICPIDLDWREKIIRDDDFNRIFSIVRDGVKLVIVLDCCHSGDGLRGLVNPYIDGDNTDTRSRFIINEEYRMMDRMMDRDILDIDKEIIRRSIGGMILDYSGQRGILISGCQSNQTSADAFIGGRYNGALTYCLVNLVEQYPGISYSELVERLNGLLGQIGFSQRPELNCDQRYFGERFLGGYTDTSF